MARPDVRLYAVHPGRRCAPDAWAAPRTGPWRGRPRRQHRRGGLGLNQLFGQHGGAARLLARLGHPANTAGPCTKVADVAVAQDGRPHDRAPVALPGMSAVVNESRTAPGWRRAARSMDSRRAARLMSSRRQTLHQCRGASQPGMSPSAGALGEGSVASGGCRMPTHAAPAAGAARRRSPGSRGCLDRGKAATGYKAAAGWAGSCMLLHAAACGHDAEHAGGVAAQRLVARAPARR